MKTDVARKVALETLINIENGAFSNIELNKQIRKNKEKLNNKDIAFVSNLVYGTVTNKILLDYILKQLTKNKFKKMSVPVHCILRMACYQVLFLDKVPKYAVGNTSVELAKRYTHRAGAGFVNAVVKNIDKELLQSVEEIENLEEKICVKYSMPRELIEILKTNYTLEEIQEIAKVYNLKKDVTVRVNEVKSSIEEITSFLEENAIEYSAFDNPIFKDFIEVKGLKNIEGLDVFKQGKIFIQDKIASLPAIIAEENIQNKTETIEEKEKREKTIKILDTCSAPGGKSTYLAEMLTNEGVDYQIQANDIYPHRVELVKENVERLGLKNISSDVVDGSVENKEYVDSFDVVLLDVPCLGLGVVRSKKDIKFSKDLDNLSEINTLQKQLLNVNSRYVKKGGVVVYSTCSILKQENVDVVNSFLKDNPSFKLKEISNKELEEFVKDGMIEIVPSVSNEGFFVAVLERVN